MTISIDVWRQGLVPLAEVEQGGHPALESVLEWMERELTVTHPDLGRSNSVCPFMSRAFAAQSVWMGVVAGARHQSDVATAVIDHLALFASLPPVADEQLKSMVLVFPDITDPTDARYLIDEVQYALKPEVVEAGFMIGELHPWNETPPRANPSASFRPNRSPVAAVALRRLHPHDVGFLTGDPDQDRARRLLAAYLRHVDWRRIPERAQKDLAARLGEWLSATPEPVCDSGG